MKSIAKAAVVSAICLIGVSASFAQDRPNLGIGYDEGIAGRYFFADRMGVQLNVGLEMLGGHDALANVHPAENPETNSGVGLAFLYTLFSSDIVYLDGIAQFAVAYDGKRSDNDIGDRTYVFLRAGIAPEILIASQVGLGMRLGMEIVSMSNTHEQLPGGNIVETDDGTTDFRFFGPKNPFNGATLGLSLFVYIR
jgi:hypothetical protein